MRGRVITGLLLGLTAFAQAGLAWHMTERAAEAERLAATSWTKADGLCRQAVGRIGPVSEVAGELVVSRSLLPGEDWRVALMDASSVISHCSTRTMSYFCMGRACGDAGDQTTALSSLEEQQVAPSQAELLRTQPIRILFRLQEVRS